MPNTTAENDEPGIQNCYNGGHQATNVFAMIVHYPTSSGGFLVRRMRRGLRRLLVVWIQLANFRAQLAELDASPWQQGVLGLLGMGASTHAGHLLATLGGMHGLRVNNFDASVLAAGDGVFDLADAYVVTSESGESAETVRSVETLSGKRPTLGVTNASESTLSRVVDRQVDMSAGTDSPVYTVGYTATLQTFALVAEWLGLDGRAVDVQELPIQAAEILENADPNVKDFGSDISSARMVDVVGHGIHYAAAAETALLLREACRVPATAYTTYQYLHGPMECIDRGAACIVFGSEREVSLADYLTTIGASVVLIGNGVGAENTDTGIIQLPSSGAAASAVLEILPMHQLVGEVARRKGLSIHGFRYHQEDTKLFPDD